MFRKLFDRVLGQRNAEAGAATAAAASCTTCGADWSAGGFSPGCAECGGGAMTRDCDFCQGRCGAVWRRAVVDSNDTREAHWLGTCNAKTEAEAVRDQYAQLHLFNFGYQTPQQIALQRQHPDWDDEDSTCVLIDAADERAASALGFEYADAFVRHLYQTQRGVDEQPYSWSENPYAHWIESDRDTTVRAIALDVDIISSPADIAARFKIQ